MCFDKTERGHRSHRRTFDLRILPIHCLDASNADHPSWPAHYYVASVCHLSEPNNGLSREDCCLRTTYFLQIILLFFNSREKQFNIPYFHVYRQFNQVSGYRKEQLWLAALYSHSRGSTNTEIATAL